VRSKKCADQLVKPRRVFDTACMTGPWQDLMDRPGNETGRPSASGQRHIVFAIDDKSRNPQRGKTAGKVGPGARTKYLGDRLAG
jgi:hypothetical protein